MSTDRSTDPFVSSLIVRRLHYYHPQQHIGNGAWNDILTSESFYWRWDASGDKWAQR
jgi:hypothetical protein